MAEEAPVYDVDDDETPVAPMLKHIETGAIYPMNPNLVRHEKMRPYDPVDEQFYDIAALEEEQAAVIATATATLKADNVALEERLAALQLQLDAMKPAKPEKKGKAKPAAKAKAAPADEDAGIDLD
jgi:hypothetical protein